MRARSFLRFTYRGDITVYNIHPVKIHQAVARLCKLLWE